MTLARHTIPAGFDSAPLYRGLPDDMCPCEHWCFLARGELHARQGDAFHLRAGHLAEVIADAELIELTRSDEYRRKAEHLVGA